VAVRFELEFDSINGVPAKGASMIGPGPVVADGMVFANSGYGGSAAERATCCSRSVWSR
jgi:hypothetical protein